MKRLCLVIPSLQAGGMERVMSELTGFFCQHFDLEVHLILYGRSPEIFYGVPENLNVHKPVTIFNNKLRQIYAIGRLFFLRKTVNTIKPDSIISFGEYWNSYVLLALYGSRIPIYISDRCSPQKKYSLLHTFIRRFLYPNAKGIIAQTEIAKQVYMKQFRHINIKVIGNPIRKRNENSNERKRIVLTVGRLISSKNHDKLIEVFCSIDKPNWKLVIIGGDALKQDNMGRLKKLVSDLGAEKKVVLTGYTDDTDDYYRQSSIFAFMSESEGFPNVIGEAMSSGLPVVSFDCVAGPSEMITDGIDGYLVPVNNYSLFKEKLELLMDREHLRLQIGSRARDSINKFSIEKVGAQYYRFVCSQ